MGRVVVKTVGCKPQRLSGKPDSQIHNCPEALAHLTDRGVQRSDARMKLHLAALVMSVASCGITDDRPQTLAYITETILGPSCATAECHSSMRRSYDYAFDTVAHAQASFDLNPDLIPVCMEPPCSDAATNSYLLKILTSESDIEGNRMPLRAPLANKDIFFIATWIQNGAPGYTAPMVP